MKKPSVTELLNLLDKPALMYWANKKGLEGFRLSDLRKKNTSKGISLHKQIEEYIKNGVPVEDKLLKENIDRFLREVDVLDIEVDIETDKYKGRFDVRYIKNGKVYLGDFKTNQTRIYLENKLQLVAYSSGTMFKHDNYSIINIPTMEIQEVEIIDTKPYNEILNALSVIYNNKKIIENV